MRKQAHGPAVSALQWRPLQPGDLLAMHTLHLASMVGMAAAVVKPESQEFLQSLLVGRGRVMGAWDGEALVAYGVLQHDLLPEDDVRPLLGLAVGQPLCKLAGAAVAPAWRGCHLQRRLIRQRLAWSGNAAVFATAAPANPASWRSLLACGLTVRAVVQRYGGLARYVLARVPGERFEADPVQSQALDVLDIERQQQLLASGWRGLAAGQGAPHSLLLGRARQEPAP